MAIIQVFKNVSSGPSHLSFKWQSMLGSGYLLLGLLLLTPVQAAANEPLVHAYQKLQRQPANTQAQLSYIEHFPKTAKAFDKLFISSRSSMAASSLSYILMLEQVAVSQPQPVLRRMMEIAAGSKWSLPTSEYLQTSLLKVAVNYTRDFAQLYLKMSAANQQKLAKFLAAGKRGPGVGHGQLLHILQRIDYPQIAFALDRARRQ